MLESWRAVFTRFHVVVALGRRGVRAGFYALLLSSGGDLIAGLTLGSITGTLESLPGLLVLVPPPSACGATCFGALGSRLGTAVHTGTFRMSARLDTLVGQNLAASISMSLSVSLVFAYLAKAISVAFGLENTISVADFVVISVIGGFLSSGGGHGDHGGGRAAGRAAQLGPRQRRARPSSPPRATWSRCPRLFLATFVGIPWLTVIVAVICAIAGVVALVAQPALAAAHPATHARQSLPRAGARRHHRRRGRPHHREALRVVPRVPRVARARPTVRRGLRALGERCCHRAR